MRVAAVDLFCGAGGLTAGLVKAGIEVRAGFDIDARCAWSYEHNTPATFVKSDISKLPADQISNWLKGADIRLIAGCAPCQPFSTYRHTRKTFDDRWSLLKYFENIVSYVRPELVTMENVPGIEQRNVFRKFNNKLRLLGYNVNHKIIDCTKFGIPQKRKRLVLIASLIGHAYMPKASEKVVTVRDTIADLPTLKAGEKDTEDRLHIAARLNATNLDRIKASKPGGSWRDWPEHLIAPCHRRHSGKTYVSVYGRMSWDEPSPTITTQCYGFGNGRFGHPEQDRAISLREAALLQSFPRQWQFFPEAEKIKLKVCGMLIGNAVPPKLGEAIGRQLIKMAKAAVHAT